MLEILDSFIKALTGIQADQCVVKLFILFLQRWQGRLSPEIEAISH